MPSAQKRAVRQLRTVQRFPTDIPAILHVGRQSYAIRVADISADGAKLHYPVAVPPGVSVTVEIGTQMIASQIIWQRAGSCGLRFASAVSLSEILRKNFPRLRVVFGMHGRSRYEVSASGHSPVDQSAIPKNLT